MTSESKGAGTHPNGILQRLRFLTKAIELVHDVWQMTRVPYEHPLTGPRYWDVARARGLPPLVGEGLERNFHDDDGWR